MAASGYDGILVDRENRKRIAVRFVVERGRLLIREGAESVSREAPLEDWPLSGLQGPRVSRRADPVRLAPPGSSRFLQVTDDPAKDNLRRHLPQLRTGLARLPPGQRFALFAGGLVAAVVLVGLLAVEVLPWVAVRLVPRSWEEARGAAMMDSLAGRSGYCRDGAGQQALDRMTHVLTAGARLPSGTFRVRVVDRPIPNAIATLGGQIALFRGLLDAAERADEVAGVLAHEMAHVMERHALDKLVRTLGMGLLGQMTGGGSGFGGLGEGAATIAYSRDAETEADDIALRLLRHANVSSTGLRRILERLDRKSGDAGAAGYFSTHPRTATRLTRLTDTGGRRDAGLSPAEWQALKTICK